MNDVGHMRRALFHARRAEGATTPNPMVGAVVVTPDGVVAGYGRHQVAGGAHAEVFALDQAGERANGATLFVTLEPCCHTGRTPPCTRRIIAAGIARVVAAMEERPRPRMLKVLAVEPDAGVAPDPAAEIDPFAGVEVPR